MDEKNNSELTNDEKEFLDKINRIVGDVDVPDSLLPENILDTVKSNQEKKNKKIINMKAIRYVAGFAAATVVFVVGIRTFSTGDRNSGKYASETAFDCAGSDVIEETASQVVSEMKVSGMEIPVNAATGNINDYIQVYEALEKYKSDNINYYGEGVVDGEEWGALKSMAADDALTNEFRIVEPAEVAAATNDSGHSVTNVQTAGIEEADIIKTDGNYIYYVSSNLHTITIYSAGGANPEKVGSIYVEEIGSIDEIYVDDSTLLVTGSSYKDDAYNCVLAKYDITDRSFPKFIGSYFQEGNLSETRKIGDIVYIVTRKQTQVGQIEKDVPETYIPKICGNIMALETIYVPEETADSNFTIISSIDTAGELNMIDSAAVLGYGGSFYMGTDRIYLYRRSNEMVYGGETADVLKSIASSPHMTEIRSIDYSADTGIIGTVKEGKVPGVVRDTFAVNEYEGYLRIMTTAYSMGTYDTENNVFILDGDLNVVGSIEGLAKGEEIYSARYMGDTAYFVTYKETDPLFSVDLSDPSRPRILGALKIPGFSEYLHNYGNALLLGIGMETITTDGYQSRVVKLSMFDVSDPANVNEKDKFLLSDVNYTDALYDYKSVMIDTDKNIFGFVTVGYEKSRTKMQYRVYTYKDGSFIELICHELTDGQDNARSVYDSTRAVYVGDYVYIVNDEGIAAYNLN